MSENDDKKSDRRTVYIITIISPNNWRARSKKHRESAIDIRKPRAFRSGSSKAQLATTCNNPNRNTEHEQEIAWASRRRTVVR
jgi:hypothetical protein